ncbi:MAG: lactonase family protein [Solirubrobacterales bacterium]
MLVFAVTLSVATPAGAATLYLTQNVGNAVSQFHVGAGGQLEALSPAQIGAGQKPTGIAVSPDGKSAYAINADSDDISQYDVGASGLLSAKSPFSYALAPEQAGGQPGIAVRPNNANVYAVGTQGASPFLAGVLQMSADGAGQVGLLTPPLLAVTDPREIAVHPTLPKLYVSSAIGGQKIAVMTIGAEGKLANAGSVATSFIPSGLAITPDGRFLYAPATGSNFVAGYSIDQTTGALSAIAGSPWELKEGAAQDVAASNDSVYVGALSLGVGMFTIDSLSGALTKKSPENVAVKGNPASVVVAADGKSAYVASSIAISQYAVGAEGVLSPLTPASVATTGATFPSLAITAAGSGEPETPVGPQPVPPPPAPPPPPPPPKIVTEYVAYQYKLGEVLVMRVTKADGKVIKTELEVDKCYPPPNVKTKCAGLVEVKTRKAGNLVIVDEDERPGSKSVLLAKGSFSIPAGKSGKIVLRPTAAGRKALKGKFVTAWLITKLNNGSTKIAGQQKIKFQLK